MYCYKVALLKLQNCLYIIIIYNDIGLTAILIIFPNWKANLSLFKNLAFWLVNFFIFESLDE